MLGNGLRPLVIEPLWVRATPGRGMVVATPCGQPPRCVNPRPLLEGSPVEPDRTVRLVVEVLQRIRQVSPEPLCVVLERFQRAMAEVGVNLSHAEVASERPDGAVSIDGG